MSSKRFCVYMLLIVGIVYSCNTGTGGGVYVSIEEFLEEFLPPVSTWPSMNNSAWVSWFTSNRSSTIGNEAQIFDYLWKNDSNYNRLSEEGKYFWEQQLIEWGKLSKDTGWWEWHDASISRLDLKYLYKTETMRIDVNGGTPGMFWTAQVSYYTGSERGKRYKYVFEAWTESGSRELEIQYYVPGEKYDATLLLPTQNLTPTHRRYELVGKTLPSDRDAVTNLSFRCGNQSGTFYIKMVSITETKEEPTG